MSQAGSQPAAVLTACLRSRPQGWNGQRGGILVLKATGSVTLDGVVHADGRGFRGKRLLATLLGVFVVAARAI